jgi:hypothetical protein
MSEKYIKKTDLERHTVTCPHCGAKALDHMTECPSCHGALIPLGYRGFNPASRRKVKSYLWLILGLAAVAFLLISLSGR